MQSLVAPRGSRRARGRQGSVSMLQRFAAERRDMDKETQKSAGLKTWNNYENMAAYLAQDQVQGSSNVSLIPWNSCSLGHQGRLGREHLPSPYPSPDPHKAKAGMTNRGSRERPNMDILHGFYLSFVVLGTEPILGKNSATELYPSFRGFWPN